MWSVVLTLSLKSHKVMFNWCLIGTISHFIHQQKFIQTAFLLQHGSRKGVINYDICLVLEWRSQ